mmetsp:Transcript_37107/g.56936  ORF Transcript_37107/g.56936 Transcript_37107/m.56936 type:complete len:152 (+) Transcript_37107:2060-2515(+)
MKRTSHNENSAIYRGSSDLGSSSKDIWQSALSTKGSVVEQRGLVKGDNLQAKTRRQFTEKIKDDIRASYPRIPEMFEESATVDPKQATMESQMIIVESNLNQPVPTSSSLVEQPSTMKRPSEIPPLLATSNEAVGDKPQDPARAGLMAASS